MANKKYTLMLGLLGLFSTASFAQETTMASAKLEKTSVDPHRTYVGTDADNSWIYNAGLTGKKDQQNRFVTDEYPYPAKPRSMWELSIGVGPSFMFSPVASKLGYGASLSLRKSLGHVFSLRPQYAYHITYGQDSRLREYAPYTGSGPDETVIFGLGFETPYVPNYKSIIHQGSLDLIVSLNSLGFYRGNPKVDWYGLIGYSLTYAQTAVNTSKSTASSLGIDASTPRADIKKKVGDAFSKLKDPLFSVQSERYNTKVNNGRNGSGSQDNVFGGPENIVRHGFNYGMGVAFKVSPRFNIGVEQKFTTILNNSDIMTGLVLQPQPRNVILSSTQLKFNFNLGSRRRAIEPLWWVNPNNYTYSKLKSIKDKVVLPDGDGDGVTDQFDLELNTPAGVPVDSRGRSLDTDGDGVPDYRDKQVVTPSTWFPVDADGVGTDPCCNQHPVEVAAPLACNISNFPNLTFKGTAVGLSTAATSALANVASLLNANPNCKVKIVAYGSSNKKAQQLSWDRANEVRNYLIQKQGISESRIIFQYGNDGDANTVDLFPTLENGPSTVPAPFPHLQKSK